MIVGGTERSSRRMILFPSESARVTAHTAGALTALAIDPPHSTTLRPGAGTPGATTMDAPSFRARDQSPSQVTPSPDVAQTSAEIV